MGNWEPPSARVCLGLFSFLLVVILGVSAMEARADLIPNLLDAPQRGPTPVVTGQAIYNAHCASCHGVEGGGTTFCMQAPSLRTARVQSMRPASFRAQVWHGVPFLDEQGEQGGWLMAPHPDISPEEMKLLFDYVKSLAVAEEGGSEFGHNF